MILNFDFNLTDLSGKPIKDAKAGKVLASALSAENKGNSIKLMDWAIKIYNDKPLDLDSTDVAVLEGIVETSTQMTALAKAPILQYILDQKDAEKKLKKSK